MNYNVYDASGDLVYIISSDGVQDVNVKNEVLKVNNQKKIQKVEIVSSNPISADCVISSYNASTNAIDYSNVLNNINNNSYNISMGLILFAVLLILLKEIRGWR